MITAFFAFVSVILLLILSLRGLRFVASKFRPGFLPLTEGRLKIIETRYVDSKSKIVLFSCDGQDYILTDSPHASALIPHPAPAVDKSKLPSGEVIYGN
jgi:hypothetical protein